MVVYIFASLHAFQFNIMAAEITLQIPVKCMQKLLADEVSRVCASAVPATFVSEIPGVGWHKKYDALVKLCKELGRDCTELELALDTAKNAITALWNVADLQKSDLNAYVFRAPVPNLEEIS